MPLRPLLLAIALLLAPVLPAGGARVWADPAPTARPDPTAPAAPPVAPGLTPAEARRLLDLLTDPRKRDAFIADLRALTKATGPLADPQAADPQAAEPQAGEHPSAQPPAAAPSAAAPSAAAPSAAAPSAAAPSAAANGGTAPAAASSSVGAALAATPAGRLAAAIKPAASARPAAAPALPLAPDSVGAQVLVGVTNFFNQAEIQVVATLGAVRDLPSLGGWIHDFVQDDHTQARLWHTLWRLLAVLALGLVAERLLIRLLRGPLDALRHHDALRHFGPEEPGEASDSAPPAAPAAAPPADHPAEAAAALAAIQGPTPAAHPARFGVLRRIPLALGQLLLELAPVLAFLMITHLAIGTGLGGSRGTRLVLLALVDAYAMTRALMGLVRLFLSPAAAQLRLLPVTDETASYSERWARRLIVLATYGYAGGVALELFGCSLSAHQAYMKVVALIGHVFIGIIILQRRRQVRRWLKPRPEATGVIALLRRRFAATWHWMALFYDAALWLIWAIEIPNGYARLWRIFAGTLLVMALARVLTMGILNALDHAAKVRPGAAERYPGLQERLHFYQPALRAATFVVVGLFTIFALLQSWGLGALTWLISEPLGVRVLSALATLGLTLLAALAVWEGINFAFNREIDRLSRQAQLARLGRLRTLLPMLRTALLITILIVVGLTILSEIGLNIAPLLAGAGVIGIAVGFGSQKLVQDVITGLFLLLENTMQVGDVVALGGLSGVVENLSIRTIRLRAEDGSVHVIPFSAVTTVTNQTRDFSHAVIDVAIGYRDDYDRAVDIMGDVVAEMRREPRWMGEIRDDLEVWGLDKFSDSGVMIKCRIRCGPFGRWSVGREFNRRLRLRFEAAGIYLARQGWADDPNLPPSTPTTPQPASPDAAATAAGAAVGSAAMMAVEPAAADAPPQPPAMQPRPA